MPRKPEKWHGILHREPYHLKKLIRLWQCPLNNVPVPDIIVTVSWGPAIPVTHTHYYQPQFLRDQRPSCRYALYRVPFYFVFVFRRNSGRSFLASDFGQMFFYTMSAYVVSVRCTCTQLWAPHRGCWENFKNGMRRHHIVAKLTCILLITCPVSVGVATQVMFLDEFVLCTQYVW